MTYSFISFPFWPGSGPGKNMRIRADADPKPWKKFEIVDFENLIKLSL